jgi:hypothetical protein
MRDERFSYMLRFIYMIIEQGGEVPGGMAGQAGSD